MTFRDFFILIKARILVYSLLTLGFGFWLGSGFTLKQPLPYLLLGACFIFSASAILNHLFEYEYDSKMSRTANRPLASGRVSKGLSFCLALVFLSLGAAILFYKAGLFDLLLILFTLVMYNYIYTPLKRMTSWNTFVGAIPGAFPPLAGFVSGRGVLDIHALVFFLLFFWWQLPHFFAIAWMYKEDYALAGFRMLSFKDENGSKTVRALYTHTFILVLLSLVWMLYFPFGWMYFLGAFLGAVQFFYSIVKFSSERSFSKAKSVMFASLFYLFLIMGFAVLDLLFL